MDLAKLNTVVGAESGFELQLVHPSTLANLGIFITVLGRDSSAYRDLSNDQSRRRIAKAQKAGTARIGINLEELERESIELLAACTKEWRQDSDKGVKDTLTVKGEELKCGHDNAVKLYTTFPWIKEQVDAAVVDRANFIPS